MFKKMTFSSLSSCVDRLTKRLDLSHASSYCDEYCAEHADCIAYYAAAFAGKTGNKAILFGFTLHILTMSCDQMLMYIKVHRVHEDPPHRLSGEHWLPGAFLARDYVSLYFSSLTYYI